MRTLLILTAAAVDEPLLARIVSADWEVHVADNRTQANALLARHRFRAGLAMLTDCGDGRMPPWIQEVIESHPQLAWVQVLPESCIESQQIAGLVAKRCYDYHTLPIDPEKLVATLGHASGMMELAERTTAGARATNPIRLVGDSPVMRDLCRKIAKIAVEDETVLITGESGTGKELAARLIHQQSGRSDGPFVAINCAALPATLIQGELFGHEKGAYTDAHERKIGFIESAHGGSLFLDEIGDLPASLQVNLLRFLQEGTIERVGGHKTIPINTRVIAATHTALETAMRDGNFREDLYYRLNVLHIHMPSLRERDGDIARLAQFFLQYFTAQHASPVKGFTREAAAVMNRYAWPGNVREMMNRIRRAVLLANTTHLTPADLQLEIEAERARPMTLEAARTQAEKRALKAALEHTRHNISDAARELEVSRGTLYRLLDKHHLDVPRGTS